jgi:hypothetical protein
MAKPTETTLDILASRDICYGDRLTHTARCAEEPGSTDLTVGRGSTSAVILPARVVSHQKRGSSAPPPVTSPVTLVADLE